METAVLFSRKVILQGTTDEFLSSNRVLWRTDAVSSSDLNRIMMVWSVGKSLFASVNDSILIPTFTESNSMAEGISASGVFLEHESPNTEMNRITITRFLIEYIMIILNVLSGW